MHSKRLGDIPNNRNRRILLSPLDPAQIPHVDAGLGGELPLTEPLRRPQPPDVGPYDLFPSHPTMG